MTASSMAVVSPSKNTGHECRGDSKNASLHVEPKINPCSGGGSVIDSDSDLLLEHIFRKCSNECPLKE
jgi:hypothetical protein